MRRRPRKQLPGLGLLEAAVVLFVILAVVASLFFGFTAWKRRADRTTCLQNVVRIQQAVRSWQAARGISSGEEVRLPVGPDGRSELLPVMPECPVAGPYQFRPFVPPVGEAAASCPLGERLNHIPESTTGW